MRGLNVRQHVQAGIGASVTSAGVLAGAIVSFLLIGVGWSWLYTTFSRIGLEMRDEMFRESLATLPTSLWQLAWLPISVLGVGLLCTVVARLPLPLPPLWLRHVPPAVLLGLAGGGIMGWLFTIRVQQRAALLSDPQQLFAPEGLRVTEAALFVIGLPVAFLGTCVFWLLWSWWYQRWIRWLTSRTVLQESARSAAAADPVPYRIPSSTGTGRLLLISSGATLLLIGATSIYHAVVPHVDRGQIIVNHVVPNARMVVWLPSAPRTVLVGRSRGDGVVQLSLVPQDAHASPGAVPPLVIDQESRPFDLRQGVAPGMYYLEAQLQQGNHATVRYASVIGEHPLPAQLLAVGLGVGTMVWLMVTYLLIVAGLQRFVWTDEG